MIAALLMTLQATAPVTAGPPLEDETPRRNPTRCPAKTNDDNGDVVVCARPETQEQFRLRPLTRQYDPVGGPGTGFRVGGGQGNVYAATGQSPDGKPDKRIMVTLKFPF